MDKSYMYSTCIFLQSIDNLQYYFVKNTSKLNILQLQLQILRKTSDHVLFWNKITIVMVMVNYELFLLNN